MTFWAPCTSTSERVSRSVSTSAHSEKAIPFPGHVNKRPFLEPSFCGDGVSLPLGTYREWRIDLGRICKNRAVLLTEFSKMTLGWGGSISRTGFHAVTALLFRAARFALFRPFQKPRLSEQGLRTPLRASVVKSHDPGRWILPWSRFAGIPIGMSLSSRHVGPRRTPRQLGKLGESQLSYRYLFSDG